MPSAGGVCVAEANFFSDMALGFDASNLEVFRDVVFYTLTVALLYASSTDVPRLDIYVSRSYISYFLES